MKNINIMGVSLKNRIFREIPKKPIYREFGHFPDLRRGLGKKEGVIFCGVDTLMHTMSPILFIPFSDFF